MGIEQLAPEAQAFARRLIRRKSCQLARKDSFTPSDREDIAQDLWLHLLQRLAHFDPGKGTIFAFLITVVERHSISILRRQLAAKRDTCRSSSLNLASHSGNSPCADQAASLVQSALDSRLCQESRPSQHHVEVAHDVASVVAQLSPERRDLCQRLQTHSVAEVSRALGMPRSTLCDRITKLRAHFAAVGLREYL